MNAGRYAHVLQDKFLQYLIGFILLVGVIVRFPDGAVAAGAVGAVAVEEGGAVAAPRVGENPLTPLCRLVHKPCTCLSLRRR